MIQSWNGKEKMGMELKIFATLSIAVLGGSSVSAQIFDPAPVKLTDGFSIVPQIDTVYRYNDNLYNSGTNPTSSSIYLLKPIIKFGSDDGINRYGGVYSLTSANYSNSSDDNFNDHRLALVAHTEYTSRHRTDFKLGAENTHEDRGTGLTEGDAFLFDEPLKYNEISGKGYYQFGARSALARVGAGINFADKKYQNFTQQTKYRDTTTLGLLTDLEYELGNVTYLTFDISSTDLTYKHTYPGEVSRDNRDSQVLIGLKWKGLAKTTGKVKVGYQHKSFDDSNRESFNGSAVDLGVTWQPILYSEFSAHVNRIAKEADTVGDYIETYGGSLAWAHHWNEQFTSELQYLYTNEDYIGADRQDETNVAMLDLSYSFTRWLKLTAGYAYSDKNSNASGISYDKNAVNLGVSVSL